MVNFVQKLGTMGLRPAVRFARNLPPIVERFTQTGSGPMVVFLPSDGRQGAALLRIYNVAAGLRALGWRTIVLSSKLTLAGRHRVLALAKPDVVVMKGVRHPLNRPHLYPGYPIVMDMDDADFHLDHLYSPLTQAMGQVTAVLAGSRYVADWCRANGAGKAHVVWTGAPVSARRRRTHKDRSLTLAWAQTRPMTYTREAEFVRDVMAGLSRKREDVRLCLFDRRPGDDPAFQAWFEAAGVRTEWRPQVSYDAFLDALEDMALGFAPLSVETPFSRGKSFGKVLAYLDTYVPVLASDACEHGAFFTPETGVVSNDPELWATEALRLLADPDGRDKMANAAHQAFARDLSVTAMVAKIAPVLTRVAEGARAA